MSENASEIKLCKDCKHSPIWLICGNVGCNGESFVKEE